MWRQCRESSSLLHDQWRFKEAGCLPCFVVLTGRNPWLRMPGQNCCNHVKVDCDDDEYANSCRGLDTWKSTKIMMLGRGRINLCYMQCWHQDPFPSQICVVVMWQRWRCCGRTLNVRKSALRILLGNLSYRARSLARCHCHDSKCKDRTSALKCFENCIIVDSRLTCM